MESSAPLFWRGDYVKTQNKSAMLVGIDWNNHIHYWEDHVDLRTWLTIEFREEKLRSPCRATFGGFYSRGDELRFDIQKILAWLRSEGIATELGIYLPPSYLSIFSCSTQVDILEQLGAHTRFLDLNFHIPLDTWSTTSLSKGNRKKLRQWNESGGVVERVDINRLPEVYEIIESNRATLGVVPSISFTDLKSLISSFPDYYQLFVGRISENLAAAAVQVKITSRTNYVFFWADRLIYRHLSPVVAICEHLVAVSRSGGADVLDLGIASERGTVNEGLARFKRNLGAIESQKLFLNLPLN